MAAVGEQADNAEHGAAESPTDKVRTAIVIVHGMGEQRPTETLNGFVKTALYPLRLLYPADPATPPKSGEARDPNWAYYYSRPALVTDSYEARVYIASQKTGNGHWPDDPERPPQPRQGQTEIYEYHWSYLMTGNRLADLTSTVVRLMFRRPRNVPDGLFGIWRVVWLALAGLAAAVVAGFYWRASIAAVFNDVARPVMILVSSAAFLAALGLIAKVVTSSIATAISTSFVDVVRYLDTSPRSYDARRAIRGGMVKLLRELHDGRYARVIVVAHSLGAYIAYDALMSYWAEVHTLHAGRPDDATVELPIWLPSLKDLQDAADDLQAVPLTESRPDAYRLLQFALWQELRKQGNPWRITDFVTVGTPMALADFLLTRPGWRSGFSRSDRADRLADLQRSVREGALVTCPPRKETLPVEETRAQGANYGYLGDGVRQVLGSQSPFAVTRWTNMWFPVTRGSLKGDWFGGSLRREFGAGISDIEITGNGAASTKWGTAHTEYFKHPDQNGELDAANHLRKTLALNTYNALDALLDAPEPEVRESREPQ